MQDFILFRSLIFMRVSSEHNIEHILFDLL